MGKKTFRYQDLPAGPQGEFLLTPTISKMEHIHVFQILKYIEKKKEEFPGTLSTVEVVQEGVRFIWGPPESFDPEVYDLTKLS